VTFFYASNVVLSCFTKGEIFMRLHKWLMVMVVVLAAVASALPAFAQDLSVTLVDCRLEISFNMPAAIPVGVVKAPTQYRTAKVQDEIKGSGPQTNTVYVIILDLGGVGGALDIIEVSGSVGSSQTVFYQISQYYNLEDIVVNLNDNISKSIADTYEFVEFIILDTVVADCLAIQEATASCPYPLPSGSVVYSIPAGAPAFFAADLSAGTGFNVKAGTWYISEFSGDFAKVWIACQARPVWVPSNAVSR